MKTLTIFEYKDEINSFVSLYGEGELRESKHILALLPAAQAHLKKMGISYATTCDYISKDSHGRLVEKTNEIISYVRGIVEIRDDLGIKEGYNDTFIFHFRFFCYYLLWLVEVMDKAIVDTGAKKVTAASFTSSFVISPSSNPSVSSNVRYVSLIARKFEQKGVDFEVFVNGKASLFKESVFKKEVLLLSKYLFYELNSAVIQRKKKGRKVIVATSRAYNMERVFARFKECYPNLLPLYFSRKPGSFGLRKWFLEDPGDICLPASLSFFRINPFKDNLRRLQKKLSTSFKGNEKTLSHREIPIGDLLLKFVQEGLYPHLSAIYSRNIMIDKFFSQSKPTLLISQMGRGSQYCQGELARKHKIPSLFISHGSHMPAENKYERIELKEHGKGLMNTPYEYLAVQTPWAKKYLDVFPTESKEILTGPLLYSQTQKKNQKNLKEKVLPGLGDHTILLHAGTLKTKLAMRPWIYETIDEFVANINSLIRAVEKIENFYLVIRHGSKIDLSVEDLKELLHPSPCYGIYPEGSFEDFLNIADLLISYSSTTIEEALQNRIPVLLYDPDDKYRHIKDACTLSATNNPVVDSCYHVNSEDNLFWALCWLKKNHLKKDLSDSLWERHIFHDSQQEDIARYFNNILQDSP